MGRVTTLILAATLALPLCSCIEYRLAEDEDPTPPTGDDDAADDDTSGDDDTTTGDDDTTWQPDSCETETAGPEHDDPDLCTGSPPVGTQSVVLEWSWAGLSTNPQVDDVEVTPVVAPLWDTNGDGSVDRHDRPGVVFGASDQEQQPQLVVLEGDGTQRWALDAVAGSAPEWRAGPAIGDLDGDAVPEIVTVLMDGRVVALDPDGGLVWVSTETVYYYQTVGLFDGDGDGLLEVVVDDLMLDHTGAMVFRAGGSDSNFSSSFIADLDADGVSEWVVNGRVWDMQGNVMYPLQTDYLLFPTPIQADADVELELLGHANGWSSYLLLELDGTTLWDYWSGYMMAPPAVGDPDGDGEPEACLAWYGEVFVYEPLGPGPQIAYTGDCDGGIAGCALADLDGDGHDELIHAGEDKFHITDGATHTLWFEDPGHSSGTAWQTPSIADVDGDGSAEVLVVADDHYVACGVGFRAGVYVYGNPDDSWKRMARRVWTQHAFDPGQVDDDGRHLAAAATDAGQRFRAQKPAEFSSEPGAALELVVVDACADSCDPLLGGEISFSVRNRGTLTAEPVTVDVTDTDTGDDLGSFDFASIAPGDMPPSQMLEVDWPAQLYGITLQVTTDSVSCVPLISLVVEVPCP